MLYICCILLSYTSHESVVRVVVVAEGIATSTVGVLLGFVRLGILAYRPVYRSQHAAQIDGVQVGLRERKGGQQDRLEEIKPAESLKWAVKYMYMTSSQVSVPCV